MAHQVNSFPIAAKTKERLKKYGFTHIDDFVDLKVQDLVKEVTGLKKDDAAWLLEYVKKIKDPSSVTHRPTSAWSLFLSSTSAPSRITTFSRALDGLLDGGVPLGSITEICGAPGVGKTQLCLQLAVNALIPEVFEGVGGRRTPPISDDDNVARSTSSSTSGLSYVYVFDTEGSFVPRRIFEIARATVDHFKRFVGALDPVEDREAIDEAKAMDTERLCDRILISRCLSLEELLAGVKHLQTITRQRRVSLVLIDSLAMHFRTEVEDLTLRTRILNGLVQDLMQIAVGTSDRPKCAVVLTNQMTTKIYSDRQKTSHLVPALGESWGHAPTHRLLLHFTSDETNGESSKPGRWATIFKSPSHPEQSAPYRVTSAGIRDAEENDASRRTVVQDENTMNSDALSANKGIKRRTDVSIDVGSGKKLKKS